MSSYKTMTNLKGFTVIELMTVITIFAISVSIATPSYKFILDKFRFKGAVEGIVSSLQTARAEAIKINSNSYVVFNVGGNWDMRSSSSQPCALSAAACTVSDWKDIKSVANYEGTSVDSTTLSANTVTYDYIRGTSNVGTISLSMDKYSADIKISKLGYVKVCSKNQATESSMGYVPC